jgi:SAM-dependent methyltransferase
VDFTELLALSGSHAEARAIQVAVKLGIFEALSDCDLDHQGLAGRVKCNPRAVMLLANALTALGLFTVDSGRFRLTETARRHLLKASALDLGAMIRFDEAIFPLWSRLENSLKTGKSVRPADMYQNRPEETERFIAAMDSLTRARGDARYLRDHLDLNGVVALADLGGGPGTYVIELLDRWPAIRAGILDLPATLRVADRILTQRCPDRLRQRIELIECDYTSGELPPGWDAIFLSNIIHSENEATNKNLIAKCFRALNPGGRILIKDHLMDRDLVEPRAGAVFSLYLLLTTQGRNYGCDEVATWLTDTGFQRITHHDLPSPPFSSRVLEARKPPG